MRPRTVLLVFSACLMVGMFAFAAVGMVLSHPEVVTPTGAGATAVRPAAGMPVAVAVEASDLWMAYARSPAAADHSFKDRALLVSGAVRSIERDYEGRTLIRLDTGDAFETVNARLAVRNDSLMATVGKGRRVALACVGNGALIGAPLLSDCSLR